ncbi:MAG: hypothetical protein ABWK53_07880 [Anaerolineales bacterium]
MRTTLFLLLACSLLLTQAACHRQVAPPSPPPTLAPTQSATPVPSPTPSATLSYTQCAWNWATQPLPELSADLEDALQGVIAFPLEARAEAFGENCLDGRTNAVAYFAARETDFYITVHVEDLTDRERLGELAESILLVLLNGFPVQATPGPQPGIIALTFAAQAGELRLRFPWPEAEAALGEALHGAALLDALENR